MSPSSTPPLPPTSPPTFLPSSYTTPTNEGNSSSTYLLPKSSPLFHSEIYGGHVMLSPDKVVSCEGLENSTTISDNPGATILSPILLSLTGITGQIIALVYLHRSTRPTHSRTVFYIMLATLIWTDLIGKIITTPPAVLSYAYGRWIGGMKMCHLHGFSMITIGLVTHFLVSAMAIDRFLCVRHGYFYRTNVTKSRARLILMSIWLFVLIFCSLPLFGFGEFEPQYPGTWCFINIHVGYPAPWHIRTYTNIYGALNFINLVVIVFCNLIVIGTLISARVLRNKKLSASVMQPSRSSYQRELEIQMVIVLVVITVVFLSSWSPLDLRIFLNQRFEHSCREEHFVDLVAIRMASLNQIVDPWVYIICRRIFTSRIWKGCRRIFIGKGFSSFKKDDKKNIFSNMERGRTTVENNGLVNPRAFERRHSLPSTELCKITLLKETDKEILRLAAPPYNGNSDDVFRDSGTASGKEGSFSSDDCNECQALNCDTSAPCSAPCSAPRSAPSANKKKGFKIDRADSAFLPVPIPLFVKEQYRVAVKGGAVGRRGKRLFSSHSAHSGSTKGKGSSFDLERKMSNLKGRSHSWSCSPSVYKQFRTQSTQTQSEEDEDASGDTPHQSIFKFS